MKCFSCKRTVKLGKTPSTSQREKYHSMLNRKRTFRYMIKGKRHRIVVRLCDDCKHLGFDSFDVRPLMKEEKEDVSTNS